MTPPPDAWVPPGCADLTNPDVFLDGPPHDTFRRERRRDLRADVISHIAGIKHMPGRLV